MVRERSSSRGATTNVATVITPGGREVEVATVAPDAQASTASTVVVASSDLDARAWRALSYTVAVATQAIKWSVFGANASDFSDEVAVLAATTVAAGANSSYSVAPPPFSYYRVKIIDDSGGVHGTATVRGIVKG